MHQSHLLWGLRYPNETYVGTFGTEGIWARNLGYVAGRSAPSTRKVRHRGGGLLTEPSFDRLVL